MFFDIPDRTSPNPEEALIKKEELYRHHNINYIETQRNRCREYIQSQSYHKSKRRRNKDLSIFEAKMSGMTEKEINKETSIPVSTIRKRWSIIKKKLRDGLGIFTVWGLSRKAYAKALLTYLLTSITVKRFFLAFSLSTIGLCFFFQVCHHISVLNNSFISKKIKLLMSSSQVKKIRHSVSKNTKRSELSKNQSTLVLSKSTVHYLPKNKQKKELFMQKKSIALKNTFKAITAASTLILQTLQPSTTHAKKKVSAPKKVQKPKRKDNKEGKIKKTKRISPPKIKSKQNKKTYYKLPQRNALTKLKLHTRTITSKSICCGRVKVFTHVVPSFCEYWSDNYRFWTKRGNVQIHKKYFYASKSKQVRMIRLYLRTDKTSLFGKRHWGGIHWYLKMYCKIP